MLRRVWARPAYHPGMARKTMTRGEVNELLANNAAALNALRQQHDERALGLGPGNGRWSACECVEHLRVTTEQYLVPMRALLAAHRAAGRADEDQTIRPGWFANWFIGQASPANRRKLPAPGRFKPSKGGVAVETFDGFAASQHELAKLIEEANGWPINRGKFPSPVTRLIRFTLGEAMMLLAVHQQRHIEQARAAAGGADGSNR